MGKTFETRSSGIMTRVVVNRPVSFSTAGWIRARGRWARKIYRAGTVCENFIPNKFPFLHTGTNGIFLRKVRPPLDGISAASVSYMGDVNISRKQKSGELDQRIDYAMTTTWPLNLYLLRANTLASVSSSHALLLSKNLYAENIFSIHLYFFTRA